MQGMGTTAAWTDGTEWRAVRDHEYTYAIYRRDRRELLFDNRRDPYQLRDLAEDRAKADGSLRPDQFERVVELRDSGERR